MTIRPFLQYSSDIFSRTVPPPVSQWWLSVYWHCGHPASREGFSFPAYPENQLQVSQSQEDILRYTAPTYNWHQAWPGVTACHESFSVETLKPSQSYNRQRVKFIFPLLQKKNNKKKLISVCQKQYLLTCRLITHRKAARLTVYRQASCTLHGNMQMFRRYVYIVHSLLLYHAACLHDKGGNSGAPQSQWGSGDQFSVQIVRSGPTWRINQLTDIPGSTWHILANNMLSRQRCKLFIL